MIYSQPCLPEGIIFSTQEEIDNFQTNYANCTEIEGEVIINGSNITNLMGLNVLTSFHDNLAIVNNDNLLTLSGLENVNTIGGKLHIINNDSLIDLSGINNINMIVDGLWIWDNNNLMSISDLNNLTSVGYLRIQDNEKLNSLIGLQNIDTIGGQLRIQGNDLLTDFVGINNISTVEGSLIIQGNNAITNLSGLENITSTGAGLVIWGNDSLQSLAGIDNLNTISGNIEIGGNISLTNLNSLENVTSIDGPITIIFNDELTSLAGLENIMASSIGYLTIAYNSLLTTCAVQSICDFLVNPTGDVQINDNAPGCNSQEEVEQECLTIGNSIYTPEPEFKIFPNPTKGKISILSNGYERIKKVTIHNHFGQIVLQKSDYIEKIDISTFDKGIYIIELLTDNLIIREKIILK
jgi:hypothetical protein